MIWSRYQEALFKFVEEETGSCVVDAVAGSGKTASLVECARRLDPLTSALFVAFNKRIVEELESRLPSLVTKKTLNSLGFGAWKRFIEKDVKVEKRERRKVPYLVREMSSNQNKQFKEGVCALVKFAKLAGLVPSACDPTVYQGLVEDSPSMWAYLIEEYDVETVNEDEAIDLARRVLIEGIRTATEEVDFDDQLYMPVITGAGFQKFDLVFVDEAQDLSSIQLEMVARSMHDRSRVIAVGDERQAIYHWRGAGSDAMRTIEERFNAKRLPLSVCYRCPKAVVRRAKELVPQIEEFEGAQEGKVSSWGREWDPDTFRPTDVILCRYNAPLVATAFDILRAGKPCKMLGRDIGMGLINLARKMKAVSLEDLQIKLEKYVAHEAQKNAGRPSQQDNLVDKVNTLRVFMVGCASVEAVTTRIEYLFSDDANGKLTLASIHRSKGLEWPRVFLLNRHSIPSKYARTAEQLQGEQNLLYVATTRAQEELIYINNE